MLSRATTHGDGTNSSINDLEASKLSLVFEDLMEKEKLFIRESRLNGGNAENVLESIGIWRRRLIKFDPQKPSTEDGGRKTPKDEKTLELLNSHCKDFANSNGLEIKHKSLDKKGFKQVKSKTCSGIEKELNSQPITKVLGKKSVDSPCVEDVRNMECDRKVHESLDTFIRQTMGREPYTSFISRPREKPLQRIIEHQQAMNKCVKSLKVDIDIRDGLEDNTNMKPHEDDIEKNSSGIKREGSLGRGLQADWNLQTIKSNVPQAVAAFAAVKNLGKQNPSMDHLTDLPGWPLLSPSKVQLQKCEKCSREFFSPFNHRRHTRTHRRISHIEKEDLILKRKNVAAFWDKLNQDEAQEIFASSRKYDLEDLSGEVVVSHLLAFKKQNNPMILPPSYMKARQDLLDILDKKQIVFPLFSEKILSILDEASEKTFLCSQGDVSKIGLEEKNLVAFLGFIVEQTLVKAWMADKDAEALRNQQELVKEEEAAQMKRERNVAKKKKKKEKSRQKGLKEHKVGSTQMALNEENDLVDDENPSPEIGEEDNSPTASSASVNSSGLENSLLEPLEMEVNNQVQNVNGRIHDVDGRIHNADGDGGYQQKSKDILYTHVTSEKDLVNEDRVQKSECNLPSNGEEKELCSNFSSSYQVKGEDQGRGGHALKQDQSIVESHKRTPFRPYRERVRVDYQDSYQRGGWVLDPRFQEGTQKNSYRTLRKPLIETQYTSNNEFASSQVSGFYRSKPTSLKGTTPFPATQQWAKKAQTLTAANHVKNGHEDESSQEYDTFISKSGAKDSAIEHAALIREMDVDAIGSINRAGKVEFRAFEKKEPLPIDVPLVAKVVAGSGGLSSIPSASFNLNVNSEEWPPLSNSHVAYCPKSAGMYSVTSYQCELNSRSVNKLNIDKGCGHQAGLESKVEGSVITAIPTMKGLVDETTTGTVAVGFQKGIMIGSVSIPLGEYVHPSRAGLGSTGRRITTPLPTHQSYTTVLTARPVRYIENPMASTPRQQKAHDGINCSEFKDFPNLQVMDSYRGPSHYRTSSIRSTLCMNLNVRHVRGPIYPLGDGGEQGILSKQPLWSSGLVRHLPQKVWRPVRSIGENVDLNSYGRNGIEGSPTSTIEKMSTKFTGSEESINAMSAKVEDMQVWDMDISKIEQCHDFAINSKAKVGDRNCVLDLKNEKDTAPQHVINCDGSIVSDSKHLHGCQETNQATILTRADSENACQLVKTNATKQNCTFHDKKDNIEKMDAKAHMETSPSHSTWIAEAVEFHFSRWQSALKDPETVVGNCEEEHLKLQTSKWIDFMDSLPSIATRLSFRKKDVCDPMLKGPDNNDQIGIKSTRSLLEEQKSTNAPNYRLEGSRAGSQVVSFVQDPSLGYESGSPFGVDSTPIEPVLACERGSPFGVDSTPIEPVLACERGSPFGIDSTPIEPILACERGSPSGVGSTLVGLVSGSQNHGKGDNEERIGSRCNSSCSDSSMSSNSWTERRDSTCTMCATCERQYMLKQGRPEEKKSC